MNKYAEELLNAFELKREHERCVNFLLSILKRLYSDVGVEEKRSEQDRLRMLLLDYETNIWSCIYRVCDFNKKYNNADAKIAQKMQNHVHNVVGYSSADEYEQILISEMPTDQENDDDFTPLTSQNNYTRSVDSEKIRTFKTAEKISDDTLVAIKSGEMDQIITSAKLSLIKEKDVFSEDSEPPSDAESNQEIKRKHSFQILHEDEIQQSQEK